MLDADLNALIACTSEKDIHLVPCMANRHGLITGATGTGKTVTLQTMAETFSNMGVPVFLADAKGDLSGLAKAGAPKGKVAERIASLALEQKGYTPQENPVCFWDVFGRNGHPLRTTISEMGPLLLSRLLNLNEVQSGLLHIVFRIADDAGLLLLDMKDLRSMIQHVGDNRDTYSSSYGQISSASVGAILRALLRLEEEGGDVFFGEPALDIMDMMQTDASGKGIINVLASDALLNSPRLYACLLLWLLSEFFERLPEVGDGDNPKLVFFFDEAHLLFDGAPQALLQKIEQVARLIRSRGVGIYFVSQSPADIPDSVLGQLGNRVQHALRAFTPKEQKAVRVAAQAFRPNPLFVTEEVIGALAVGEALVSFLDANGSPCMVERAYIVPPQSQVGPIGENERKAVMNDSLVAGVYDTPIDRESAYEVLTARMQSSSSKSGTKEEMARQKQEDREKLLRMKEEEHQQKMRIREENQAAKIQRQQELQEKRAAKEAASKDIFGMLVKQTGRTITSTVGREIGKSLLRGVLGTLFGKR